MITTGHTYPNMGWLWIGAFVVILSIAPATSGHGADPAAKPETGAVKDDSSRNWFTDMFNISTETTTPKETVKTDQKSEEAAKTSAATATKAEAESKDDDPLEGYNRFMHGFNKVGADPDNYLK